MGRLKTESGASAEANAGFLSRPRKAGSWRLPIGQQRAILQIDALTCFATSGGYFDLFYLP